MQSLILAGGKGTRLRPLTLHTPKPIVPIANRPFLFYQLDLLRPCENESNLQVVLSLSYQPRKIEEVVAGSDINLYPIVELQPLGTAGAFKFAETWIKETTLVFNGDILSDVDLRPILARHRERKAIATLILVEVENVQAYGVVELDDTGAVKRFLEKPKPNETQAKTINAGMYLLEPEVLKYIPANQQFSFEYELFPKLLQAELPVYGDVVNAYWLDIGTPERYLKANMDVLSGKIRRYPPQSSYLNHGSSIVDKDCVIKSDSEIISSVIGSGCFVDGQAKIENSVLWPGVKVNTGAHVKNAILGRGVQIGKNSVIEGLVIGDKSYISDYFAFL